MVSKKQKAKAKAKAKAEAEAKAKAEAEAKAKAEEAPEVEAPEVEAPEVEAPEVEAPEVEAPEVEAPEVEAPEVEDQEFEVAPIKIPMLAITQFTHQRVFGKGTEITEKEFNQKVKSLAESIKKHGLIHAILVRPIEKGDYEVVCGYRRYIAHKQLKRDTIEAKIQEMDEKTAISLCVHENVKRDDLTRWDYFQLFTIQKDQGLTNTQIAKEASMTTSNVSDILSLSKVTSTVQKAVMEGKISSKAAKQLKDLTPEQQETVLETVLENGSVSSSDVKAEAEKLKNEGKERAKLDKSFETLTAKVATHEAKLEDAKKQKSEKQELDAELKVKRKAYRELESSFKSANEEDLAKFQKYQSELKTLSQTREALAKQEAELGEKQAEIQEMRDSGVPENINEVSTLEKEIRGKLDTLKRDHDIKKGIMTRKMAEVAKLKTEVSKMGKEIKDLEKSVSKPKREYDEMESLKHKINDLVYTTGDLSSSIARIEEQHTEEASSYQKIEVEGSKLRDELANLQAEIDGLNSALKKLGNPTKEIENATKTIKASQEALDEVAGKLKEINIETEA